MPKREVSTFSDLSRHIHSEQFTGVGKIQPIGWNRLPTDWILPVGDGHQLIPSDLELPHGYLHGAEPSLRQPTLCSTSHLPVQPQPARTVSSGANSVAAASGVLLHSPYIQ